MTFAHASNQPLESAIHSSSVEEDWPERSWGLALLGGIIGYAVYALVQPDTELLQSAPMAPLRVSLASLATVFGFSFAYVVERRSITSSLAFAAITALIVSLALYWNLPHKVDDFNEPWRIACSLLSIAIAAPLFQAWRGHRNNHGQDGNGHSSLIGLGAIPYRAAFDHAWTGAVLWFASWAFVAICWALAILMAELFQLIGIGWLTTVLKQSGVIFSLTGIMLGAGIGLLRDREAILGLLQRVVTTVLSVLAPVLAVGLVLFLAILPFTGLSSLWQATKSTTPILLLCIIGALCLINAVVGPGNAAASANGDPIARAPKRILRASAFALCLTILPLAVITVISTGLRISQYGITPQRLWAVTFTGVATAYGIGYLGALLRAAPFKRRATVKRGYADYLRSANLHLAFGLAALTLLLATPLVNFGALSVRDQIARLNNGSIGSEQFDWAALRYDFGPEGPAAVKELSANGRTAAIKTAAARALDAKTRWELDASRERKSRPQIDMSRVTIKPEGAQLPPALLSRLLDYSACAGQGPCTVFYQKNAKEAVIMSDFKTSLWLKGDDKGEEIWTKADGLPGNNVQEFNNPATLVAKGAAAEVREITVRQVFVNGHPVNDPIP